MRRHAGKAMPVRKAGRATLAEAGGNVRFSRLNSLVLEGAFDLQLGADLLNALDDE